MPDVNASQGEFKINRTLNGALLITCPPAFVVPPAEAVKIALAILRVCGVETIQADPGQTVIRAPKNGFIGR